MNLRPLFILCLLALLQFHASAQIINPDGYYINLNGDSIPGKFINYQESIKSPASVAFQPAGATQTISLTPANCRKLSVAHYDTYIAYKGKRLTNETDSYNATEETDDIYEDVTVFLREVFNDSHYQLYELADNKRYNYYVSSSDVPLEELYFKVYMVNNSIMGSPRFRSQLSLLFKIGLTPGNKLQRQLEKISYNSESLQNFFMVATTGKAQKTKEKYPLQVFAGLGASFNLFAVKGDPSTAPVQMLGTYNTNVSPVVEAGIKLYNQRNFGRLFFTIRLNLYQYKNTTNFPGYTGSSPTVTTFKATVVSLPISYGYQFVHKKDLSVSFSLGGVGLLLMNNTLHKDDTYTSSDENNSASFTYTALGELEATLKKKVSFYAGGYLPATVADYVYFSPRHSSIKAGLRYYF